MSYINSIVLFLFYYFLTSYCSFYIFSCKIRLTIEKEVDFECGKKKLDCENKIINDLKGLLAIESVRDDAKASEDAPVDTGH